MNHSSCAIHDVLELVSLIIRKAKKEGVGVVDLGRYCVNSCAKSFRGEVFLNPADFVELEVGGLGDSINVRRK